MRSILYNGDLIAFVLNSLDSQHFWIVINAFTIDCIMNFKCTFIIKVRRRLGGKVL